MATSKTHLLQPGLILTVTSDALSSGNIVRLSDVAGGGDPFAPIAVPNSTSISLGPFTRARRYMINSDAGGVGTAAGGWDTAGNRDLAIARFAAALADIADIRAKLNSLLAKLRASGQIQ